MSQDVSVAVTHGDGKVSIDIGKKSLSIGNDTFTIDTTEYKTVTGQSLKVTGGSITVGHNGKSTSGLKMEDGYLGAVCTTKWSLRAKGHPWTATITIQSFVGFKPQPPEKPPWWANLPVVGDLGDALGTATNWLKGAGSKILDEAPGDWETVILDGAEFAI